MAEPEGCSAQQSLRGINLDVIRVGANNARGASQGVVAGQGAARDVRS